MEDFIIIAILAVFVVIGVYAAINHFKAKGGCCGSNYKPKKKKLANVLYKKTFKVDGMHCEHCKSRVEETVNGIKGVAARVNLKKGELTVMFGENVDDEIIKAKIEKAGYTVEM